MLRFGNGVIEQHLKPISWKKAKRNKILRILIVNFLRARKIHSPKMNPMQTWLTGKGHSFSDGASAEQSHRGPGSTPPGPCESHMAVDSRPENNLHKAFHRKKTLTQRHHFNCVTIWSFLKMLFQCLAPIRPIGVNLNLEVRSFRPEQSCFNAYLMRLV